MRRAGIEIERKSRLITIYYITVDSFEQDVAVITVTCSKGTYIRTLAEDIGKELDCGAHLIGLRRNSKLPNYKIAQTITLAQLEAMTACTKRGGFNARR